MNKAFDILGLGCTAVDELLYVSEYPQRDSKIEVERREKYCGGLCATALVAGARLGARCAYAGTLGVDGHSEFVKKALVREGVDIQHVVNRPGKGPVHSTIVVEKAHQTRTILYETKRAQGADARHPAANIITSARVLLVDRFGLTGMLRAARIARSRNIPIVGDFEGAPTSDLRELIGLTDHLIVSTDFARTYTETRTPAEAATKLWNKERSVVIVTCGAKGCWIRDASKDGLRHFPAFQVPTMDTTGCGDVFHGAYAAALAWDYSIDERLQIASASAALKAATKGGQSGIPNWNRLEKFLRMQTKFAN